MSIDFCDYSMRHESKPLNGDASVHLELASNRGLLIAVSDGVSTRPRDWEASDTACLAATTSFRDYTGVDIATGLRRAVETAHAAVQDLAGPDGKPLATIVLAHCDPVTFECMVASVGDSRAYLAGAEGLSRLTQDDSKSVTFRRDGELVLQGGSVATRSGLTQALGQDGGLDIAVTPCSIEGGEMLALVTDGIHELGGFEQHLLGIQNWLDIETAAMKELANHHLSHGRDDGTYALIRRSGPTDQVPDPTAPGHLRLSYLLACMEVWASAPDPVRIAQALDQIASERLVATRKAAFRVLDAFQDDGAPSTLTTHRRLVDWARALQ